MWLPVFQSVSRWYLIHYLTPWDQHVKACYHPRTMWLYIIFHQSSCWLRIYHRDWCRILYFLGCLNIGCTIIMQIQFICTLRVGLFKYNTIFLLFNVIVRFYIPDWYYTWCQQNHHVIPWLYTCHLGKMRVDTLLGRQKWQHRAILHVN